MVASFRTRCSGPVVTKHTNPHMTTTVLDSCYEVFVLICCLFYAKCGAVDYSHSLKDNLPEIWQFFHIKLCKRIRAAVFFVERCFLLAALPYKPHCFERHA